MSDASTPYRVRRPLTAAELDGLRHRIDTAANTTNLLHATVTGVLDALLADLGDSVSSHSRQAPLDPRQYAIPASQWAAIADAAVNRAHAFGTAVELCLNLVNVGPSTYDDPAVAAPDLTVRDYRPDRYRIDVNRQAADEITACEQHLQALCTSFGPDSDIYRTALDSWHRQLAGLFSTGRGSEASIQRDGRLSLYVTTGSGFVYGVIFHGQQRRCTAPGCSAIADDDPQDPTTATWRPSRRDATVLDHEHQPSYPIGAAQPGTWSAHS
jgi:hypothetical protein